MWWGAQFAKGVIQAARIGRVGLASLGGNIGAAAVPKNIDNLAAVTINACQEERGQ